MFLLSLAHCEILSLLITNQVIILYRMSVSLSENFQNIYVTQPACEFLFYLLQKNDGIFIILVQFIPKLKISINNQYLINKTALFCLYISANIYLFAEAVMILSQ